jgi:hypothetical protein
MWGSVSVSGEVRLSAEFRQARAAVDVEAA